MVGPNVVAAVAAAELHAERANRSIVAYLDMLGNGRGRHGIRDDTSSSTSG
jgi:hypothetical protein